MLPVCTEVGPTSRPRPRTCLASSPPNSAPAPRPPSSPRTAPTASPPGPRARIATRAEVAIKDSPAAAVMTPPVPLVPRMMPVPQVPAVRTLPDVTVGALGRRVPGGDGQHVPDVPPGVVVGEDGPPEPGRRAARGAVGAQHPRGGEDGVRRVVRGEAAGRVDLDGVLGEGGRLELHRPLGALAVLAVVDAPRVRPAVVRLHRPDSREHLPGEPGAGPGRAPVPGQVARRDGRQ